MIPPPYAGLLGGRHSRLGEMSLASVFQPFDLVLATPGLVSFYPFDEADGPTVIHDVVGGFDLSGSTNHAAVLSAASGPAGRALVFPHASGPNLPGGSNPSPSDWGGMKEPSAQALYSAATPHSLTQYSVEVWFAPDEYGQVAGTMETVPGVFTSYPSKSYLAFWFRDNIDTNPNNNLELPFPPGGTIHQFDYRQQKWKHYAFTYDGTDYKTYVNGSLATTTTTATPPQVDGALGLGGCGGQMYGMAVYSRALSAAEIALRVSSADPAVFTQAQVTAVTAEVLRTGTFSSRVTSLVVEALIENAVGADLDAAATTGIDIGCATGWVIGHTRSVSVTTGLKLGTGTYGHVAATFMVSAGTGLDLRTGTYRHIAETFDLHVASGFDLGAVIPLVRVNNNVFLAVRTGIDAVLHTGKTVYVTQTYNVAATTAFAWGAASRATRVYDLSASTSFGAGGRAGVYNTRKPVSAATGLVVRVELPEPTYTRVYHVAAFTSLDLAASAPHTLGAARLAHAATAFRLAHAASETRDAVARATTRYEAGAVAVKAGRDIFVSVTTGMGMGATDSSNKHPHLSPSTAFVLYVTASAVKTGTPAGTGFEMTHLAQAEVSLPWRRGTLTLPPGGQIPH